MQIWTAIVLGFVGSLHCAGMCGPLLIALAKARPKTAAGSAGPLAHHAGRIAAYAIIGLVFGFVGHLAAPIGLQRWLSIALGILLIMGLILAARIPLGNPLAKWITVVRGSMLALIHKDSLVAKAGLGALNGLLPCGLVYVAAVGAAASENGWTGAAYMGAFGLGTIPMTLGIHLLGERMPLPSRLPLRAITSSAVIVMAALLILRGLELGIPFLSPAFGGVVNGEVQCH